MTIKDPQAILDYAVDWTGWLQSGETITDAEWAIPPGITQATPAPSVEGGRCVVWLSGGTAGTTYRVVCHVTTSMGRQDDRSHRIDVMDR